MDDFIKELDEWKAKFGFFGRSFTTSETGEKWFIFEEVTNEEFDEGTDTINPYEYLFFSDSTEMYELFYHWKVETKEYDKILFSFEGEKVWREFQEFDLPNYSTPYAKK